MGVKMRQKCITLIIGSNDTQVTHIAFAMFCKKYVVVELWFNVLVYNIHVNVMSRRCLRICRT